MTYRPAFVKQLDGSRCGSYNCVVASAAMALDRDTLGASTTTPAILRDEIGGACSGLTLYAAENAVNVIAPPKDHLDVRPRMPWAGLLAEIAAGRGAMLMIDYSPLVGTAFDCFSGRFSGTHCGYVNELSGDQAIWGDPGADGRRIGIPKGWQTIPLILLRKAAGAFPGVGLMYAQTALTRDTEPAYRVHVPPLTEYQRYYVEGNRWTGHSIMYTKVGFTNDCSVPASFRFKGDAGMTPSQQDRFRRSLVRVTNPASAHYGWYIGAQWTRPV